MYPQDPHPRLSSANGGGYHYEASDCGRHFPATGVPAPVRDSGRRRALSHLSTHITI